MYIIYYRDRLNIYKLIPKLIIQYTASFDSSDNSFIFPLEDLSRAVYNDIYHTYEYIPIYDIYSIVF